MYQWTTIKKKLKHLPSAQHYTSNITNLKIVRIHFKIFHLDYWIYRNALHPKYWRFVPNPTRHKGRTLREYFWDGWMIDAENALHLGEISAVTFCTFEGNPGASLKNLASRRINRKPSSSECARNPDLLGDYILESSSYSGLPSASALFAPNPQHRKLHRDFPRFDRKWDNFSQGRPKEKRRVSGRGVTREGLL